MSKTCDRCGKKLNERDRTTICLECEVALADEINKQLEAENVVLRKQMEAAEKRAEEAEQEVEDLIEQCCQYDIPLTP